MLLHCLSLFCAATWWIDWRQCVWFCFVFLFTIFYDSAAFQDEWKLHLNWLKYFLILSFRCSVAALIIWDLSWDLWNCSMHRSYFVFHVNNFQKVAWTEFLFLHECSQQGKSALHPLFNGRWVLSSASDKAKLFAKIFSKNSNLEHSGISLPAFSYRTNLKLHNIFVTHKMVKKVIANLDLSKASGPDCIPFMVPELCNICLKESCFPDCWKVSLVVPVFKNDGGKVCS